MQVLAEVASTATRGFVYDASQNITHEIFGGAITATSRYEAFGGVRATSGSVTSDRGFASAMRESTTDLIAMGARHYDPATGTFLQTDPLYLTTNELYAYANNNPYAYWDPSGLKRQNYGISSNTGDDAWISNLFSLGDTGSGSSTWSSEGPTITHSYAGLSGASQGSGGITTGDVIAAGVVAGAIALPIDGPFGDVAALAAFGSRAAQVAGAVGGTALLVKMNSEIRSLTERAAGPRGVQYSLRVMSSGMYPCYGCSSGVTRLDAGDVWKYGETINPASRYSEAFLRSNNLVQVDEFYGTQIEIKVVEKLKIYNHFWTRGELPPGNRIFR